MILCDNYYGMTISHDNGIIIMQRSTIILYKMTRNIRRYNKDMLKFQLGSSFYMKIDDTLTKLLCVLYCYMYIV